MIIINVLVHKTGTTSSFQIQHRGERQHVAFVRQKV